MPSSATKIIIIEETGDAQTLTDKSITVTKQITIQLSPEITATEAGVIVARAISLMERSSA